MTKNYFVLGIYNFDEKIHSNKHLKTSLWKLQVTGDFDQGEEIELVIKLSQNFLVYVLRFF